MQGDPQKTWRCPHRGRRLLLRASLNPACRVPQADKLSDDAFCQLGQDPVISQPSNLQPSTPSVLLYCLLVLSRSATLPQSGTMEKMQESLRQAYSTAKQTVDTAGEYVDTGLTSASRALISTIAAGSSLVRQYSGVANGYLEQGKVLGLHQPHTQQPSASAFPNKQQKLGVLRLIGTGGWSLCTVQGRGGRCLHHA